MGIWNRLFRREVRSEVVAADNPLSSLLKGVEISPETAMEIPAVSSCIDFISDCIAGLPIRLYRENRQTNSTEEIKDDDRLRLLNDETGDLLDPFQMKKAVVMDFFLYGSGYIYPEMDGNRVLSLRYIPHGAIASLYRGKDPVFKVGQYVLSNGLTLWDDQVIKLLRATKDGLSGQSVVEQHQQILSAMYREIIYEKMLTAAGGNKKGFITTETKLSAEAMEQLHKNWRDMYATTDNTMMILNKGLQFHESSNTSVEMQLNENKVRNNELVCQIFGMSSEAVSGKLGDDAAIAVIKNAVIPVVTAFENALDRGLLLPSERDRTYYAFDTSELLKGDILKRYQAYKTGLECNVLQIDEARYKEDLPPLGLNWIKLGLQDVLYDPKTKVIYTPNMNQSMAMSENKVSFGEKDSEKPVDKAADNGIMEKRGWVTINDKHVFIGEDSGGGSSGGGTESGGTLQDSSYDFKEITDEAIEKVPKVDVFGDDAKNSRYQQANKDLLKEAQKYPVGTEVSIVYGADMKPIKECGYRVGENNGEVKIDNPNQPYHGFHNHPSGNTLSPDDVFGMAERDNMLSLTAAGNNSSVFCMQRGLNANGAGYRDFLIEKFDEGRFMGGTFSYCDIKGFNMSALPDELRIPLQKEVSAFCDECIQGGQQYGFSYTYSGTN